MPHLAEIARELGRSEGATRILLHRALAKVLQIPQAHIRVIACPNGGGFGGKSDIFNHEIVVSKAALILRRPVKIWGIVSGFMTVNVVLVSTDMFTPPCSPNSCRSFAKDSIGSKSLMMTLVREERGAFDSSL